MNNSTLYDVLIIGGGINGVGIAYDAAGRGLSVLLCEQDDLASATSSASSKLIHGGLRYLEQLQFKLVKKALHEREVLLNMAPHIIKPVEFVMPYHNMIRPYWMLRLGLYLYDHLAKRDILPSSHAIKFNHNKYGQPLKSRFSKGLVYSDCKTNDARLVILTALGAKEHGATIKTQHKVISAERKDDIWQVRIKDRSTGKFLQVQTKVLINATGPWLDSLIRELNLPTNHHQQLIKGSHIITNKLYDGDQGYLLQHTDKRIIFVRPYADDFTLIGTTDIEYTHGPDHVSVTDAEIDYLIASVNSYFTNPISRSHVISSFAGLRPLIASKATKAQDISREYIIDVHAHHNEPILVNVFGGKITTFRILAEQLVDSLRPYFSNLKMAWTADSHLPGGDIAFSQLKSYQRNLEAKYPNIPSQLIQRYINNYGTRTELILKDVSKISDLGIEFGHGLYESEVRYLIDNEWARTVGDILWRRTNLGLMFSMSQTNALNNWLQSQNRISSS